MLTTTSIVALRRLATFPIDAMLQEIGPMALVQRGVRAELPANLHKQLARTVDLEGRPKVARQALGLLLDLADGLVIPLGRDGPEGTVLLGRAEDVDVLLMDASVSAHHAQIRYDGWARAAWVTDAGSRNGTLVNGMRVMSEAALADGNVVSLGDETAFLFLRTETLYALVRSR